jgi:meiotically up-regulated gene 157 (Mug157) protein
LIDGYVHKIKAREATLTQMEERLKQSSEKEYTQLWENWCNQQFWGLINGILTIIETDKEY